MILGAGSGASGTADAWQTRLWRGFTGVRSAEMLPA